ncbi:glycoside hydrolase family 97 protein [Kordiimonas sp.]|uniref:glycoside hydrolase family 97 protein n=1 Tax=Kordiimonas sp. TaxID=1970157 RepID=UPI003A8E4550
MILRLSTFLLCLFLGASQLLADEPAVVTSPNGKISVAVKTDDGRLYYEVAHMGKPVLAPSRLGFRLSEMDGFDDGLSISAAAVASHDDTWTLPWGEREAVCNHYNELKVTVAEQEGQRRHLDVVFRVFDDGIGFRYDAPAGGGFGEIGITDEITEFAFAEEARVWWIPARWWNRYEYVYNETQLHQVPMAHTPITMRRDDGLHISVHEAALTNYSGMSLEKSHGTTFKANLAPGPDGVKVRLSGAFVTPWRTIQITEQATGLLNSNLILNLNEPNKLGDVSWVQPGKYVGIWWGMHLGVESWGSGPIHGATTENTKRYIDFAAKYGFDGVLVEGWNEGWDGDWFHNGDVFNFTKPYPDYDLEELGQYARDRGVRIIGHHETSGSVTNYENQMADSFALLAKNGVAQVKTGYVAHAGDIKRLDENGNAVYEWHDGQFMSQHHERVLIEAAKHKISINAHEPIKDTGLRRTYPNWLAREGARGQEYNAWGSPGNPPSHTAVLPYTRMLSGPMDFTPGIFDLLFEEAQPNDRVRTTLAKQLSLYVVIYSPIQMAADLPENYEARLDAFQFIRDVPTDWSESIALNGEIGDYVTFARKAKGSEEWFLGSLTNEDARRLSVSLDFLSPGQNYRAEIYRDGADADWDTNPYAMVIESKMVTAADTLALPLAPGGGMAVRFVPVN